MDNVIPKYIKWENPTYVREGKVPKKVVANCCV